jgi:SAM-dependent methyltransferase
MECGANTDVTRPRGSFDADYLLDDIVAAEPWHFWFRARRRLVLWALRWYFPRLRSLLDVGCGTGFVLDGLRRAFPDLMLAGCDVRLDVVCRARQRLHNVRLFQGDVLRLPVRPHLDAITALDVIEHLDDDEEALAEMFRALNPGGGLLITVPQHQWLWSVVDEFSRHRRRYSRADVLAKMQAAGFRVLRCTSFFSSILPLLALRRFQTRGQFDAAAELRMPRTLNAAVAMLLQPEWLLIRTGVSLPMGGSLLIVAERPHL